MSDIYMTSNIIDCCDKVISRRPDIFLEQLFCPVCDLPISFTTRICKKCGMGIPDFEITKNTHKSLQDDDGTDEFEDLEKIPKEEFLNDIGAIKKILQIAEEWDEECQRSTKFRIFEKCENLKTPKFTDYIGAYRTRGIIHTNLMELEKALHDFKEVIRVKLYFQKTLHGHQESKYNNSLTQFNILKSLVCRNLAFDYVRRGVVYSKIKQYTSAFKDFAIAMNLNFSLLTYKKKESGIVSGSIHNEGQFNEVIDYYNSYIEANPNDAYAYACRGFCMKNNWSDSKEQAIKDLSKSISLAPDLYFSYYVRGFCHGYNLEKSIEDFTSALSIKKDHVYSFLARGRAYYTLKKFGKTIKDFETAYQIEPECLCLGYDGNYNTFYKSWLNRLYDKKSNCLKRVTKLSKDVFRDPQDASRYFTRGKAYYELGHFEALNYSSALADFEESLLLEPNIEIVHVYRGLTLIKLRQYDSALAAFNKALSLKPGYLFAYNSRGIAYYEKGDYVKAKDDFDQLPSFRGKDNMCYRAMVEAKLST